MGAPPRARTALVANVVAAHVELCESWELRQRLRDGDSSGVTDAVGRKPELTEVRPVPEPSHARQHLRNGTRPSISNKVATQPKHTQRVTGSERLRDGARTLVAETISRDQELLELSVAV